MKGASVATDLVLIRCRTGEKVAVLRPPTGVHQPSSNTYYPKLDSVRNSRSEELREAPLQEYEKLDDLKTLIAELGYPESVAVNIYFRIHPVSSQASVRSD